MRVYRLVEAARLPLPGDNVAVAIRRLDAGTRIDYEGMQMTLDYTVLEGHRFAVKPVQPGEALLSWELPFGLALKPIQPGSYVINQAVLDALRVRSIDFTLPESANFADEVPPFVLDEASFQAAPELPSYANTRSFMGYLRSETRGVGTRNMVVLLGTSSRTGSYVRQLAERLQGELPRYPQVDGIVPAAHTEGAEPSPNNLELLLRTLAGFMVNPNVGAVLAVDDGDEAVTNRMLHDYMLANGYPLGDVTHRFLTLPGSFQEGLAAGEAIVREWLPLVNAAERTEQPLRHLKIGLQCGGSDAFSGISANPLLGWISEELIRHGGSANLAETDELIGAEPYVLQRVRNIETARKFLSLIETFRERASWHGANAEGNPSGGNKYRGLYNIYLKSIGAARKKAPTTRLDDAITYGAPMKVPGFSFMDSPGNDLESIAGQVASGCNLIFFTTGNGSITNFPFVPTIKVVTTTSRYELLAQDMDLNAGEYLDGTSMDQLGMESFDYTLQVASGLRSVGERAGHAQVQIWRNWRQTDGSRLPELLNEGQRPTGRAIDLGGATGLQELSSPIRFTYTRYGTHVASSRLGLILPTSLCSGQIAGMIAERLNRRQLGIPHQVTRFVALAHTEGCGNSGGASEDLYSRTMIGYAAHPLVGPCLLLEHGCEKTHNDYMRHAMGELGIDAKRYGYASIQLDGGIEKVTRKVEAWFAAQLEAEPVSAPEEVGLEALRIGIVSDGPASDASAEQLAALTRLIVEAGGTVVVAANSGLLAAASPYRAALLGDREAAPSLAYGQHAGQPGFHLMETPTGHVVETVTGLAATGVELIVALAQERPLQAHPFVPMLQLAAPAVTTAMSTRHADDLDLVLEGNPHHWVEQILQLSKNTLERRYTPRLYAQGNIDFQLTRGLLGVSL